jgi:restriction system protein
MKKYCRIMAGTKSAYADECFAQNYIGANFDIDIDLTDQLPEDWREFNRKFIPIWLSKYPDKSKVAAGLACGALWTLAKGMEKGDIILTPDGRGNYKVGEVTGGYSYHAGQKLPHRRVIKWLESTIDRAAMSQALKNSTGSIGTVSDITKYALELETLISGDRPSILTTSDETIEDPSIFALEKHLEDFLVENWKQTELGKLYDIYEIDGELVGQQYPTDTGPMDILAISKDKKSLLVVELKKGRASDSVVGQIQRYMGYVKEELAEENQSVKGIIVAMENDLRIKRALAVISNIEFYKYQVSFKLFKS